MDLTVDHRFLIALLEIIWINILLSGDNAVAIALACRPLPPHLRRWGVMLGSLAAVILRIIFKLKIADIIINVTAGGPGGATDSVSSFIYRVYRDRSNVGYGTMLAMVYLVIIIVFVTLLLNLVSKRMQRMT